MRVRSVYVVCVIGSLHQVFADRPQHMQGSTMSISTSLTASGAGANERGTFLTLPTAEKAMRAVASILNYKIDFTPRFTNPGDYIDLCIKMIDRSRHYSEFDSLHELESLYREDLLRTIYGPERASEILVSRGQYILLIDAYDSATIPYNHSIRTSVFNNTLEKLHALASPLKGWNPGRIEKSKFSRPRYHKELIFLVGREKADRIFRHIKKAYTAELMRAFVPKSKTVTDKLTGFVTPNAEQIYRTLKGLRMTNLSYPYQTVSYYNLDKLTLVLGEHRAEELVIARARFVLRRLLGKPIADDVDLLKLCEQTIADLDYGDLLKKVHQWYSQDIWFLVGPKLFAYKDTQNGRLI